jgi:hypothetical protein
MLPTYVDRQGRRWLVSDLTGIGEFDTEVPLGSPRATFRQFRGEHGRRVYAFREGERGMPKSKQTIREQFGGSFDPDAVHISRSVTAVIQELYANRRGMGRR